MRGTVRLPQDSSILGTVYWGYVGEFVGPINIQLESDKDALRELLVFVNICSCLWGKYSKHIYVAVYGVNTVNTYMSLFMG